MSANKKPSLHGSEKSFLKPPKFKALSNKISSHVRKPSEQPGLSLEIIKMLKSNLS